MILDAILLALAEIASTQKRGVAILPEMRIGQGDGVQISHPDSGYELWLSGSVDYVVIDYEDVRDYKSKSDYFTPSLSELPHVLLRTLGRPWWIQTGGRSRYFKRSPVPRRSQTPECRKILNLLYPGSH
jgi:hypothetical protein